jgi:ribosomal protein S18 acetylase RimI-like enzyme
MGKASAKPRAGTAKARAAKVQKAVRVRPAGVSDRDHLVRLRRQAERAHARLMPDYFREAPADAAGAWEPGQGAWAAVLVAEAARQPSDVLGFVAIKVVVTPRDPAMVPRRRAHVDVIVVDESHREAGIGKALMRAATDWARDRQAEEVVLTVWADNDAAEALYRALGYQPLARILRKRIV